MNNSDVIINHRYEFYSSYELTPEAQELSDEGVDMLIGQLIYDALCDYYRCNHLSSTGNTYYYKKHGKLHIDRNANEAELFFKSELFQLTGLDAEYLKKHFIELKKKGLLRRNHNNNGK